MYAVREDVQGLVKAIDTVEMLIYVDRQRQLS